MKPTPERTQAIRDYFERNHDRAESSEPNPLFAGRDRELNRVLHYANILDRSETPRSNMTALLYGAPGAGKSEMLVQLKAALRATESENPPIVIDGNGDILMDAGALTTALYTAAPEHIKCNLRDRGWKLNAVSMKFGPIGLTAPREPDQPAPSGQVAALNGVAHQLREVNGGLMPTVVLLIDEAQAKLAMAARHPDEQYALSLHLGETGLKALTVYGGLSNTKNMLDRCGVTRPGHHMNFLLRRLEDDTVYDTAAEALAATTRGADEGTLAAWANDIATFTQGWPAHLSTALHPVIARARENGWSLDRDGFDEAMTVAGERRREYYADRLERCPDLRRPMRKQWVRLFRIEEGEQCPDETDVAAEFGLSLQDADALVDSAVAAGLIEPTPDGYISPIPSLLDHIEDTARGDRSKTRGGR